MKRRTTVAFAAATAVLAAALPATLAGQVGAGVNAAARSTPARQPVDTEALGLELRVIPRFGLFAPDDQLYEVFENWPLDPVQFTAAYLGRSAVAGVTVEAALGDTGLRVRAEVLRTFEGWLTVHHGVRIPRTLFIPPVIEDTWLDMRAHITTASLQAVLPTRLSVYGVEPYLLVGYAAKWYAFGAAEPADVDPGDTTFPQPGFLPSLDAGAGLTFRVLGVPLDVEVRDSVNRYWGWTQHDVVLMGGVAWRVF